MYDDERDNLRLNENAYFYTRNSTRQLPTNLIQRVFRACSADRVGRYLYNVVNEVETVGNYQVRYSICIFKSEKIPTFIDPPITNWVETKISYIIVVEIENYVIISKKSVNNITQLLDNLSPIDYSVLLGLFVSENTTFEQFALQNLNISNSSMRSKSVSAIDLKENFSPLGANTYMLRGMRVSTGSEKITLALNTSRINKFGDKQDLNQFFNWCINTKNKIEQYVTSENFTSIFATPVVFEDYNELLNPIAILFNCNELINMFDTGTIVEAKYQYGEEEKSLSPDKILDNLARFFDIVNKRDEENPLFKVESDKIKDVFLRINKKSITLSSKKLKNIILYLSDGTNISLLTYLNINNEFIITFDDVELIYSNRKLFRDSKLLDSIDQFLTVFEPYTELNTTTTEKGELTNTSTSFGNNSVFRFVEEKFSDGCEYLICDDLQREWADHIALTEDGIIFYHEKSKSSQFSASAFQDVIGQAQKNFGNLLPTHSQLSLKTDFWKRPYTQNTPIVRLRKGDSVDNAVDHWKKLMRSPYKSQEVYIVVDFISKDALTNKLRDLKDGNDFVEKNEVVQILWFISSLISSSQELGVRCKILCKS